MYGIGPHEFVRIGTKAPRTSLQSHVRFGPDLHAWDNIDVSNPSPIIKKDGSVIMLYKVTLLALLFCVGSGRLTNTALAIVMRLLSRVEAERRNTWAWLLHPQ